MARGELGPVLGHIRRLAAGRTAESRTDQELLADFAASRSEIAFTELVRRHGRLVLTVCGQVLGQAQDAEDASQATFLVLARKAATIRRAQALPSWLYGVAFRRHHQPRSANIFRAGKKGVRTLYRPPLRNIGAAAIPPR